MKEIIRITSKIVPTAPTVVTLQDIPQVPIYLSAYGCDQGAVGITLKGWMSL